MRYFVDADNLVAGIEMHAHEVLFGLVAQWFEKVGRIFGRAHYI